MRADYRQQSEGTDDSAINPRPTGLMVSQTVTSTPPEGDNALIVPAPSKVIAWVDGACSGNNSKVADRNAWGSYLIRNQAGEEFGDTFFLDANTSNKAEYQALIKLLTDDVLAPGAEIRMDSMLVVGHLTLGWKIKAPNLRELAEQARRLLNQSGAKLVWVGREEIEDKLGH